MVLLRLVRVLTSSIQYSGAVDSTVFNTSGQTSQRQQANINDVTSWSCPTQGWPKCRWTQACCRKSAKRLWPGRLIIGVKKKYIKNQATAWVWQKDMVSVRAFRVRDTNTNRKSMNEIVIFYAFTIYIYIYFSKRKRKKMKILFMCLIHTGCRESILQSFIGRNWLRWEKNVTELVPRANRQNWQMTPRRPLCFAGHVTIFRRALILLCLGGSPMVYTVKQSVFISPKVNCPSQTSATVPPKTDPPF